MKIVTSILIITIGIISFRFGNNLLGQIEKNKSVISVEDFWDTPIDGLDFTPNYFFNTMPNNDNYPLDGIIYFKTVNNLINEKLIVIDNLVIQNNQKLVSNKFIFIPGNKLKLKTVVVENLLTGDFDKLTDNDDIKQTMLSYKGFVDLWVLYNTHK